MGCLMVLRECGLQMPRSLKDELHRDGFAIVPSRFDVATLDRIACAAEGLPTTRHGAGARNLLDCDVIRDLALNPGITSLVEQILGRGCFAVRALWFDKTSKANWTVAWHQDLTIAVQQRRDAPGFGPWTTKAGVQHVQPPVSILQDMLAVRLHIDPCDAANGPLRVLPRSHREGRIPEPDITRRRAAVGEVVCIAEHGGLLLMRPLLLHASSPATALAHRRVLHLEFSSTGLPHGLQWHYQSRSVNTGLN